MVMGRVVLHGRLFQRSLLLRCMVMHRRCFCRIVSRRGTDTTEQQKETGSE
jgi:hypothetical protein